MRVTPFVGRKGDVVCEVDGILCLFDRRGERPEAGVEIEVMICASLGLKRHAEKPMIAALIVQPVTDDHVLIDHDGFECSGSMCRTTANASKASDEAVMARGHRDGVGWITPGRTPVREVSNINVRWDGRDRTPPIPGRAYVSLQDLRAAHSRIAGVPTLDEVSPQVLRLLVRRKARVAA